MNDCFIVSHFMFLKVPHIHFFIYLEILFQLTINACAFEKKILVILKRGSLHKKNTELF